MDEIYWVLMTQVRSVTFVSCVINTYDRKPLSHTHFPSCRATVRSYETQRLLGFFFTRGGFISSHSYILDTKPASCLSEGCFSTEIETFPGYFLDFFWVISGFSWARLPTPFNSTRRTNGSDGVVNVQWVKRPGAVNGSVSRLTKP